MGLWDILGIKNDTVPSATQTETETATEQPIILTETSANGETQTFTINTNGGNYNHVRGDVLEGDYYEGGVKQEPNTQT